VSAIISSSGNEALVVMALKQGLRTASFSPEILKDVLRRPRFGFPEDEVNALLAVLRRHGSLLDPVPINHISPDPDDDPFSACALEAEADFLVTGNRRHFPPAQLAGIKVVVVNAAELLEFITLS
jgi:uncharacterized protein